MPLLRRGRPSAEERSRTEASLASLEQGGIPLPAQERLDELRARGGGFFTSDLSVNEFLLVREAGFRPVTQVLGSSFYHVGWQQLPWSMGGSWNLSAAGSVTELETQSHAWNEARRLALGRLSEEAARAGADAVVGVRLDRADYDWAAHMVEFTAVGTAVSSVNLDLGDEPVLSNLSGQDFAKLFEHGYWPLGIVAASTVCYVVASWQTQRATGGGLFGGWSNQELTDYTQGLYEARGLAMAKVERQGHELEAAGIVGLSYEQSLHEHEVDQNGKRTDLVVTLHVTGTAIGRVAAGEDVQTSIALTLD